MIRTAGIWDRKNTIQKLLFFDSDISDVNTYAGSLMAPFFLCVGALFAYVWMARCGLPAAFTQMQQKGNTNLLKSRGN